MAAWVFFPSDRGQSGRTYLIRRKYQVSGAARNSLKCKYRVSEHVRLPARMDVVDVINQRMAELQADDMHLNSLVAHGVIMGWNAYETIYQEAVQTLMSDGTIYPDGELCGVAKNVNGLGLS